MTEPTTRDHIPPEKRPELRLPAQRGAKQLVEQSYGPRGTKYTLGRFSKVLPPHLQEIAAEAARDPNLLALDESIGVIDARIVELLGGIGSDAAGQRAWTEMRKRLGELDRLIRTTEDVVGQLRVIAAMETLMEEQFRVMSIWQEVYQGLEAKRKLVETETKRREKMSNMMTADQAIHLVHQVAQIVKRNVKDPNVVREVGIELTALVNGGKAPALRDVPDAYEILEEQIAEGIVPDPRTVVPDPTWDNRGPVVIAREEAARKAEEEQAHLDYLDALEQQELRDAEEEEDEHEYLDI